MRIVKYLLTLALTLILIWISGFAVYTGTSLIAKPQATDEKSDAIIVLTGGNHRVATGLELFANDQAPKLFISGVFPDTTLWTILKSAPPKMDKEKCCIELGYAARSTTENAAETKKWIEENNINSIRLVTSNYHMHRAYLEIKTANPKVQILKHPVQKEDYTLKDRYFWQLIFTEYHKTLFRFLSLNLGRSI